MSVSAILCGLVDVNGGPGVKHSENLAITKRRAREFAEAQVPCPQCGGEAWRELAPLTITSKDSTRVVHVVTCHAGCRQEIALRWGGSGMPKTRPARFQINISKEEAITMPPGSQKKDLREEDRKLVAEAIEKYGRGGMAHAARVGNTQPTSVKDWIRHGANLSDSRADLILEWARGYLIPTKDVAIEPAPDLVVIDDEVAELPDEEHDEIAAAVATMEPYPETRTLRQAVNGLGVLPASDDEPIALTVAEPVIRLASLEQEFGRFRSPADVMLEQVARRGALAELERLGLELPEGARVTISLEWGPLSK